MYDYSMIFISAKIQALKLIIPFYLCVFLRTKSYGTFDQLLLSATNKSHLSELFYK